MFFDFHTHCFDTPLGEGIVCLPQEVLLSADGWQPEAGGRYAAGIHPWWTGQTDFEPVRYLTNLRQLLQFPEMVQLGECGLDRLKGAPLETQLDIFRQQIALSEETQKPVTIHCVKAFDLLLAEKKQLRPTQQWTIHGFRGKPALALQLLDAGFDLSFGPHHNPESWNITPPERRHQETDAQPY